MESEADVYLRHALVCEQLAVSSHLREDRARFRQMAEEWRQLATEAGLTVKKASRLAPAKPL